MLKDDVKVYQDLWKGRPDSEARRKRSALDSLQRKGFADSELSEWRTSSAIAEEEQTAGAVERRSVWEQ